MDEIAAELLNAKVAFGLLAQGRIPTVERMLAEGKNWDEIGKEIGWCGDTAERFYGYYLAKKQRES